MSDHRPRLGITMGDSSGIGGEVSVKAYEDAREVADIIVVGDADVMHKAMQICDVGFAVNAIDTVSEARFEAGVLDVLDVDNVDSTNHDWGDLREEYGRRVLGT